MGVVAQTSPIARKIVAACAPMPRRRAHGPGRAVLRTDALVEVCARRLALPVPLCVAAFTLFHFVGMLGVSEAQAECVASLLKRYSPA
eukprot:2816094-Alexandrium_andersonii.AAC.1